MEEIKEKTQYDSLDKFEIIDIETDNLPEVATGGKEKITLTEADSKLTSKSATEYKDVTIKETTEQQSISDTYQSDKQICENPNERNILLLGQTGVGKSTFINSLANFIKFKDFQSALGSQIDILSPCEFTIVDDNFQTQKFHFGFDDYVERPPGQSLTQTCQKHEIQCGNYLLRIFDTPGFGDTRGVDQDKINLKETFDIISKYKELHCICIILKSNESKLSTSFQYTLKQFLFLLQKDIVNNLMFLFTHSQETFFRPGDTIDALKAIIGDKIPLCKSNMFCIDNESFKFLLASQNGFKLHEQQKKQYSISWEKSDKESKRLIELITKSEDGYGLKSYDMNKFICLTSVRTAVDHLLQPLAQTVKNIQENLHLLHSQIQEVDKCGNNKEKLKNILEHPIVKLKVKNLDKPRTVCNSSECVQSYRIGNVIKVHYLQNCCGPCECQLDEADENGQILCCAAFNKSTRNCLKCSCSYLEHKQIYYENVIEEWESINSNPIAENITLETARRTKIQELELKLEKINSEVVKIYTNTAKLVNFLQKNAIVDYKDEFEIYLNQQIANEKMLTAQGSENQKIIDGLDCFLLRYQEIKNLDEEKMSAFGILNIIAELESMETSGEDLVVFSKAKQQKSPSIFMTIISVTLGSLSLLGAISVASLEGANIIGPGVSTVGMLGLTSAGSATTVGTLGLMASVISAPSLIIAIIIGSTVFAYYKTSIHR